MPEAMVIMKFGGTSVAGVEAMQQVAWIVAERRNRRSHESIVLVTSACAGITNHLASIAASCAAGNVEQALTEADEIAAVHREMLVAVEPVGTKWTVLLEREISGLENAIRGTALLEETTPRVTDRILATGELLSSVILTAILQSAGIDAIRAESAQIIRTDHTHGQAEPVIGAIRKQAAARLCPLVDRASVIVLQGFVGGTDDGVVTTLGRGGSDYSASLLGAALDAVRIEIWTDVDGIMSADPRRVPTAQAIPIMSASEAATLSRYGAKVIHPETIRPAIAADIPVVIRNTKTPEHPGTTVVGSSTGVSPGFHAITGRDDMMLVRFGLRDAESSALIDALVNSVATPGLTITTTDATHLLFPASSINDQLQHRLDSSHCECEILPVALICLTGSDLRQSRTDLTGPIVALEGIRLELVSASAADDAILFVVDPSDLQTALEQVHAAILLTS